MAIALLLAAQLCNQECQMRHCWPEDANDSQDEHFRDLEQHSVRLAQIYRKSSHILGKECDSRW
jgi:hypothetical protein